MPLSLTRVLGMWLRKVPVGTMRRALRVVEQHRLPVTIDELEAHFLAGGDVERVLAAALRARELGQPDDIRGLFGADLAGQDLDTFVERGGRIAEEVRRKELRERATHDPGAAAQVHAQLSDALSDLEAVTESLASPSLIHRLVVRRAQREEMFDNLRRYRAELERDLAQLEERWPQLKKSS